MAQTTGSRLELCLKTERLLREVSGRVTPENVLVRPLGTWESIMDAQMAGNVELNQLLSGKQIPQSTTNAGDRIVQLKYWKPDCSDAAQCSAIDLDDCADVSDDINTYAYDQIYPNSCVGGQFSMDPDDYIDYCVDTVDDFQRKLIQEVRKMMKAEDDALALQLASAAGNYPALSGGATTSSLTSPKTLNLLGSTAPVKPQPLAFYPVYRAYADMGVADEQIYGVGGSIYWRAFNWANDVDIFGGNMDGFDPSKTVDIAGYTDLRFDDTLSALNGSARVVTFIPGSVANVNWFKYQNAMLASADAALGGQRTVFAPVQNSGNVVRQTVDVGSALFGKPYLVDMFIEFKECTNKINFRMKRYYDLWHIPDDAFVAACDQAHNYILMWSTGASDLSAANVIQ